MKKSMEAEKFDSIVKSQSKSALGARSVLCSGYSYRAAAQEFNVSQQAISTFINTHLDKYIKE